MHKGLPTDLIESAAIVVEPFMKAIGVTVSIPEPILTLLLIAKPLSLSEALLIDSVVWLLTIPHVYGADLIAGRSDAPQMS